MKLKFNINYNTQWGECLYLNIIYTNRDKVEMSKCVPMKTDDGCLWALNTSIIETQQHPVDKIRYYYIVKDAEGCVIRSEWDMVKREYSVDSGHSYIFRDLWRDTPLQMHLYSNAYITSIGGNLIDNIEIPRMPLFRKTILFRVSAPQLKKGEALAILGNHPAMGCWNQTRYLKMDYCGGYEWILTVDLDGMQLPLEYKYVIINENENVFISWEEGENRYIQAEDVNDGDVIVLYGETLRVCEPMWKAAGLVIPVFSLRSKHSYGVGDFGDLKRMVDWAEKIGLKIIQILPINDTTSTHHWSDSYPYNSISVYALHPHYMDIEQIGELKDKRLMTSYYRQRQELNTLNYSDYEAVERVKSAYLHSAFNDNGKAVLKTAKFKSFFDKNKSWLKPYAAFCVMRDKNNTANFNEWTEYSIYNDKSVEILCNSKSDYYSEICYIYYVQYNLYEQLKSACSYARKHHVAIKGDLPIGVSRNSVETWMYPQYFNLDSQTGAPPDSFSTNGQNWGFPTYNWENIEKDGYQWWKKRLSYMSRFFDAYRIDHVLGFFRIWEIPKNAVLATLGHFSPSLPLTVEEIEHYGLPFRKELFTSPFINNKVLDKIFGIHSIYVCDKFLVKKSYNFYDLKQEYDTQEKIKTFFDGKNDENSIWIRDGLYRIIANVLFIPDPRQCGMYHPRICAYQEQVFDVLNNEEKDAYMRLYNNYFYFRHDIFWGQGAIRKLQRVIGDNSMLFCAEDLGMLPGCVENVLDRLRILSLEIQTMPKDSGVEFSHISGYPYRSVATISTHDMAPLRLWWEENPEQAQRYYTTMMQKEGRAPSHLTPILAEEIVARHLYSPSMLCILSFQDVISMDSELRSNDIMDERINVPSDSYNHWQYRMHLNIEELLSADNFNRKFKTMVERSKR
ncbi:4-alpha-glucanotransferase [Xylanibacter oryzae]|uniref:4-alpha-glucanotransferase n=1 Tax=Xylanibacter oryzae TaxID=185293 RepID=UPI0004AE157A|nr:4-alpha-glucanotransferase [Xylanibacter oryzae]